MSDLRMTLTDKERTASAAMLKLLEGLTFDEAEHVLAHARGRLALALDDLKNQSMFRLEGAGNHG
jgi:hypothetical protein